MDHVRFLVLLMLAFSASATPNYYDKTQEPPGTRFYVRGYGAKCDGSTDDTTAFQATATAMSTTGGTFVIPRDKNCIVGGVITLPSHSHVIGGTLTAKTSGFPWSTNAIMFTNASSATDITIEGVNFVYPASASGATHIIQLTSTASDIRILHNTTNYGGDAVANIGATNVSIIGNNFYNCANACVDSWSNASKVRVIANTMTVLGSSARGIEFTGLTTALTAANSSGLIAIGNDITLLGASEQAINVDGLTSACAGVASEKHGTIGDNHIFMAAGIAGNAILLRFCANYWDVHDNQIFSDGTNMAVAAIAVNADSNSVLVHHNIVYNWNNQTSGAERGLFRNGSVGGTLEFNECYSCTTATTTVGATDTTSLIFANDTGSGALTGTFGSLTISPGTSLSQATWGTAGIALIGSAFTANDTTTGSGGVNQDAAYSFGAPTFTNTQGTANVLTNAVNVRFAAPICGAGWASCTNLYSATFLGRFLGSLGADISGASINLGDGSHTTTLAAATWTANATTVNGTAWALLPAITATSVTTPGQVTSSVATGTAPLVVASTTNVPNLNVSLLNGKTFADPGPVGSGTPSTGAFTTLTSSSGMPLSSLATQATNTVTGNATSGSAVPTALVVGTCSTTASALIWTTNTGFGCNTTINAGTLGGATFAAPGAIGGGTPGSGAFTTLTATTTIAATTSVTAGTKYIHGVTTICTAAVASAATGGGSIAAAAVGNLAAENNIAVCTIPAGLVPAGGILRIIYDGYRSATTTNTTSWVIRDSATSGTTSAGGTYSLSNSTSGIVQVYATLMVGAPTTTSQVGAIPAATIAGASASAPSAGSQDRTAATYINFNCINNTTAGNACGYYFYSVELLAP